ncbi:MAG: WYL domain-containing protein [Clostridia bacterium]|nr:WYL domain-containing protein [Clostridia bacterium]
MDDNVKKIRIMKIWEILNRETDEDHPLTTEQILERLDAMGVPCHRKTLYEDIKVLNATGYEVLVNRALSNEYYVMERTFDIPELQILMDAVQATRFISTKKTEELVRKIAMLAGASKAEVLKRNIVEFNTSKSSNEQMIYNVNEIALAIELKKKVSFLYFKLNAKHEKVYQHSHKRYLVNPLATIFSDDKYYLVCFDDKYGNVVHYRVDRMENVMMEPADAAETIVSKNFDAKGRKKQLFSMFVGNPERVSFEADSSIIDGLFDKFGDDLVLSEEDGKLTFTTTAEVSPTFISWVVGFGGKLKITAPKRVVNKVKDHLIKSLEAYGD